MYQIVVINPGSTSNKIALFRGGEKVFTDNVSYDPEELSGFAEIKDQFPYRYETIKTALLRHGVELEKTDAFSAICTGLKPMAAGVYEVNDLMYADGAIGPGSKHPGNLGPMLARDFAKEYGGRAFVVDPSSADEFCLEARLTGFQEVIRTSRGHPLNQRAAAMRCSVDFGKPYRQMNLIVAHMGGGISVTAHCMGKMIDTVDSTRGEGRMAPTRSGAIPVADVIEMCYSGKYTRKEMLAKVMKTGGWMALLGTSDAREVQRRIDQGDTFAELVYRSTAYQIAKDIGACAAVLNGNVDAIVFTGGLAYAQNFVEMIRDRVQFIAPVQVYPGEFEMEALAAGALRVLREEENPLCYTGEPVFRGFREELGL